MENDMNEVKCPACDGSGNSVVLYNTGLDYRKHFSRMETCRICLGVGKVTQAEAERIEKRNSKLDDLIRLITKENHE